MRNRRDDLRNIALIVGAGALGVVGTVFVTKATETPRAEADRAAVRQQAVVEAQQAVVEAQQAVAEALERAQEVREMVVVGASSDSKNGVTVRIRRPNGEDDHDLVTGLRAQPIIYIDGVRVDGPRSEAMKLVEPDRIDRIEVLKGPAARQRYGSEARDGVIQIFTKPPEESSKEEDGNGR